MSRLDTLLNQPLDQLQGTAARMASLLPEAVHHQLTRLLGHQHHHPELDPALATILAVRDFRGGKGKIADDPVASRAKFRREMASIRGRVTPVGQVQDISMDGMAHPIPARHYAPIESITSDQPFPLLIFFHGGGFVVGDLDTHDEPCRMLCRHGHFHVLSIDYRLAPEHPFPAAFDDGVAAIQWVHQHANDWNIDLNAIAIGGDSAGGNLSATLTNALAQTEYAPAAQLLIYPAIEFYMPTESKTTYSDGLFLSHADVRDAYLRYNPDEIYPPDDPRLCPMYPPDPNQGHRNLPPTLIITAALDVLRDEGEVYGRTLRQAGNTCMMRRVAGQGHGFINITSINRGAYQATLQMAADFRLLLAGEVF